MGHEKASWCSQHASMISFDKLLFIWFLCTVLYVYDIFHDKKKASFAINLKLLKSRKLNKKDNDKR